LIPDNLLEIMKQDGVVAIATLGEQRNEGSGLKVARPLTH